MLPAILGLIVLAGGAFALWSNKKAPELPKPSVMEAEPLVTDKKAILERLLKQGAVQSWGHSKCQWTPQ
jgi:hypothetical protein